MGKPATAQHTPKMCGCRPAQVPANWPTGEIDFCQLHAAAPRMLKVMHVLLGFAESVVDPDGTEGPVAHMREARAILRDVEG